MGLYAHRKFTERENTVYELVIIPQILTNSGEAFNLTAKKLIEIGYKEINLNLGCPSGTVVNKGRGSGALKDLVNLEKLLEVIFNQAGQTSLKISIKTRIGYEKVEEFDQILSFQTSVFDGGIPGRRLCRKENKT